MVDLKSNSTVTKKSKLTRRHRCRKIIESDPDPGVPEAMFNSGLYGHHRLEGCDGYTFLKLPRLQKRYVFAVAVVLLILLGVLAAYFMGAFGKSEPSDANATVVLRPPNPQKQLPPSASMLRTFKKAAVCSDGPPCAEIGKSILERNGSAVDATIAAMFCNGIVNMQSMGLGGGFLMTIYVRENKTSYTLNAREVAPIKSTLDMFKGSQNASKVGPLSIAVPGELRGYWEAYKRFGKLPWKDLVQPSVDLCERGYELGKPQHDALFQNPSIKNDATFREWFMTEDGKYKKMGSRIVPKKLCETLKIVAESDGDVLYNGTLSKILTEDLKELGSIITAEDLQNYKPKWIDPVHVQFKNGDNLYSVRTPGSGLLLAFILNILDGFGFTRESVNGINNTVLTYHRIIEAFKFAFAKRTELGDEDFVDIKELVKNLTSTEYARNVRLKIKDNTTNNDPAYYGAVFYNQEDHGTAHISVIAPNGDAVSVTSTINIFFGSALTSKQTGIVLNSGMDDFSYPTIINYFGLPGSPNNAIAPGKHSLSSMTPSIITDKNGDVRLVVGASGGTRITTAVAWVIIRTLWFGDNVKEAVDAPRIHHQVFPMEVTYEYGILQQIVDGLEALGHKPKRVDIKSVICALLKNNDTIYTNADYRKGGDVYGIN